MKPYALFSRQLPHLPHSVSTTDFIAFYQNTKIRGTNPGLDGRCLVIRKRSCCSKKSRLSEKVFSKKSVVPFAVLRHSIKMTVDKKKMYFCIFLRLNNYIVTVN